MFIIYINNIFAFSLANYLVEQQYSIVEKKLFALIS